MARAEAAGSRAPTRVSRAPWWRPRRWPIWSLDRPALGFVLVVIVGALVVTAVGLAREPPVPTELALAALLIGLAATHLEVGVALERVRRELSRTPNPESPQHTGLFSAWTVAAALLLPGPLAALVCAAIAIHTYVRVVRRTAHLAYRFLFSWCTFAWSCYAVSVLAVATSLDLRGSDPATPVLVGAALLVYLVTETVLVAAGVWLAGGGTLRALLLSWDDRLEVVTLALGAVLALTLASDFPWMAVLLLPVLVALHRAVTVTEIKDVADQEATGLQDFAAWQRSAGRLLERADEGRFPVVLVSVHLESPGEEVRAGLPTEAVTAFTRALRSHGDPSELVGVRYGNEFIVVAPGSGGEEFTARLAERITVGMDHSDAYTMVIGSACYPGDAVTLLELLDAASVRRRLFFLGRESR